MVIGDIPPLLWLSSLGLTWSAWSILHAVENVEQTHCRLLSSHPTLERQD